MIHVAIKLNLELHSSDAFISCYEATHYKDTVISLASGVPHLTDVVAAGGSDGLVDHLLTHDAVECLLDTTQQTSLKERTMQMTLHYSTA